MIVKNPFAGRRSALAADYVFDIVDFPQPQS
jgi:hypothetical protein